MLLNFSFHINCGFFYSESTIKIAFFLATASYQLKWNA